MLNRLVTVQECDATEDDSSNEDGLIKKAKRKGAG